jgi:hypothetical protein
MPGETTCDLAAIRARQADREIGPLDGSDADEASADCAALLAEVARLTRGLATADTIREQETQRAETTYARLVGAHDWATGAERERDDARAEVARLRAALDVARTDEREACARLVEVYSEGIAQFIRDRSLGECAGSPATTGGTTDAE